jgi:predicted metal-dependent RNase
MNQYSSLFLDSIILDSPLWKRVTDIFLENLWSKYKLLDRLIQKELFWKEVVRVLEKWEHKMLYKDKRAKSKEIIISSGWMLQWWAVINHLKEIISDVNAKIIFTWYQSVWTIWNKILSWDKQIIIEWEIYDVKCSVTQVKWYSSHIGHSDLVEEIWVQMHYSKKAIVALNHWWESRMILADAIKNICSRVNVIMPNLYDDINISL